MNRHQWTPLVALLGVAALVAGCAPRGEPKPDLSWIQYPAAERGDAVDLYHGVEVADPYRWMEDESSDATQAWLAAQDRITERAFEQFPVYQQTLGYLDEHWLEGVTMIPVRRGDNAFFFKAVKGQMHDVLYVQRGDSEPEAIFDLNARDTDGTRSTRASISVSPQGRYVGYPIHQAGADAAELRLYDTEAGRELDEFIPTAYSGFNDWLPDESGFFYSWVDVPTIMGQGSEKQPGVYLHRIGTAVEQDVLVYHRPWEGQFMAASALSDDEKHLLILDMSLMGSRGRWGVRPLKGGAGTRVTWLMEPEAEYRFALAGVSGSEIFLITDYEAPNWRIVAADIQRPGLANLREVVPEQPQPISMLAGTNRGLITLHDERLYVTYIQDTSHVVRIFDLQGESLGRIELPFQGTVSGIQAKKDDPLLYFGLTSYLQPHSVYAYDSTDGAVEPIEVVEAPAEFANYTFEQAFYASHDGTRIPLSIIRRADAPRDGSQKLMLYGYGGWGIPTLPSFQNRIHAWLNLGGTWAIAHIRGGGEYGVAWHEAGQFFNKQDVFDDFYAAAEHLVREKYTTHPRITILGASNGGLLTAVAYNQRPELFGAVISEVAATDMLRLQDTPIGTTVTNELGRPDQSEEMFRYLRGYSPLHNVRHEGPYPAMLNVVGENDPRCKPGHIYKYVAELQQSHGPDRVVLLRVVRGAGHGSGRKTDMVNWFADEVAFGWAMTR